jgi:DNA-binding CsgD family transcriptional regulator
MTAQYPRTRKALSGRIVAQWRFTPAEARVVERLAGGLRTSDIAATLGVSIHTVRTQLKRAMRKAGVHTQAAMVAALYASKE